MKVLFSAVGSIGSRHLTNLSELCAARGEKLEADVMRYSDRTLPDNIKRYVSREIREINEADDDYDVLFITDKTGTHAQNINLLKGKCKHIFIEKPIFDTPEYNLEDILPEKDESIYYVACPIRFSKYYEKIREIVSSQNVISARIIFSSYMPNWQAGRDYRKSFRCSSKDGGGVDIDSLHEIDYMMDLFGKPKQIYRVAGKYSNLEMDACDIATYIFQYEDKVVEVHLDYFGRVNNRRIELFTDSDTICIDFNKKTCEFQLSGAVESYGEDNCFYQDEMKYFYDLIHSEDKAENINPPERAMDTLRLAKGII